MVRLDIKSLMVAFGTAWAVLMLFLGWVSIFGWGRLLVDILSSFYIGFGSSFIGGFVGGMWGFLSGALWGGIIGYVYNYLIKNG